MVGEQSVKRDARIQVADTWGGISSLSRFLDREAVPSAWSPFLGSNTWDRFLKTRC